VLLGFYVVLTKKPKEKKLSQSFINTQKTTKNRIRIGIVDRSSMFPFWMAGRLKIS
jgi:hypothetical protein